MKQYTILHTIYSGGPGGAETLILNLATRLDPKRFRSIVVLPQGAWLNRRLKESGVTVFEVDWGAWYDVRGPLALVRIIRREKVDLIHSHLAGQNFYSCLAGLLTGRKTLVTYHGAIELKDAKGFKGALRLWFVRNVAVGVVVVCNDVRNVLEEQGFPSTKIVRVYNGIDTARFAISRNGNLRKELNIPGAVKLVGMVANIRESKGYDFFVRAARKVLDIIPDVRFLAVGDVDRTIADPVLKLVDELSLKDTFIFLGFREDIPEILSELDVFVLASTREGLPLVMLEAMAARKPMVVTRCGGPQEVIEDGETGLLVPPCDADALAMKICQLLRNRDLASTLGANALIKVNREFTLDAMINKYERLYETHCSPESEASLTSMFGAQ